MRKPTILHHAAFPNEGLRNETRPALIAVVFTFVCPVPQKFNYSNTALWVIQFTNFPVVLLLILVSNEIFLYLNSWYFSIMMPHAFFSRVKGDNFLPSPG